MIYFLSPFCEEENSTIIWFFIFFLFRYLYNNQLTGSIPSLNTLTSLVYLWEWFIFYLNFVKKKIQQLSDFLSFSYLDIWVIMNWLEAFLLSIHSLLYSGCKNDFLFISILWSREFNNYLIFSIFFLFRYLFNNELTGSIPSLNTLTSLTDL